MRVRQIPCGCGPACEAFATCKDLRNRLFPPKRPLTATQLTLRKYITYRLLKGTIFTVCFLASKRD